MKFAICNEIFKGWKLDAIFSHAAQLGYKGVELAPFTIADSVTQVSLKERGQIRDAAERHGIEIVGLHWLLVKPEGLSLNHPDAGIRGRTAEYFAELVNFCADLGGKVLVVGSPKQRNLMAGISREQGAVWALETLKPCVEIAESREVAVCLEPLAPAETNFINTAAEAIELVRRADSPALRIILDVKAMCAEAKAIPEIIRESFPYFPHFHANDRNLKGPGFGEVDFVPIAAALREVGYGGWVSVEVFRFEEGPETIAAKSIEYLRRVFGASSR
ncbi:MAG TPA: sugar phosphate isomerase/epimerase [Verrucomicrobiae bacterium]|nr:sugar phosphate isomerase/epimerase [Verrucomicrobiae bacterium]